MKSHKASTKRFKITGTGKIKRKRAGRSHLNQHMTSKAKRRLDKPVLIDPGNKAKVLRCIPYLKYSR